MKNLMQLKDLIKNLAKEKNINSQVLLKNYMMQRLLLKIANSVYKNNLKSTEEIIYSSMLSRLI